MKAECIRCTAPTSKLKLNLLNCITIGWGAIGDEEWKERGGVALRVLISEAKPLLWKLGQLLSKSGFLITRDHNASTLSPRLFIVAITCSAVNSWRIEGKKQYFCDNNNNRTENENSTNRGSGGQVVRLS